jgi:hypothetical protein
LSGSKKYKNKLRVYCRRRQSATADHVFPRELFHIEQRNQIPKVPSCEQCNNEKSRLEHYLTAVLPFGATHSDAKRALSVDAAKRLNNNHKLHKTLNNGFSYVHIPLENGGFQNRLGVTLDHEVLHDWIGFVGRGLMWYHWDKRLPLKCHFEVFTPSSRGIEYLSYLFQQSSTLRVDVQLGDGTVRYKGVMSEIDEGLSIWAIQLLGGMTVSDKSLDFVFENSFVAMITGAKEIIDNLDI